MALTQISTAGVKDDAVTAGKIPANAVGSSELADNAVDTAAIADDAVTDAKLANSINSAIAANTAKASITINNNADNRVITGSGTANTLNGESGLSYDGSVLQINGDGQFTGNDGTANQLKWDKSDDSLYFRDNVKSQFGTGGDLQIYHDGTTSRIHSTSHPISIRSGGQFGVFKGDASEAMLTAQVDGAVELYYNNSKKFETTNTGATVTGNITGTGDLTIDTNTLYVDSSQNRVGINTTSPSAYLNIKDTSNDGAISQLLKLGNDSSGAGTGAGLQLGAGSGNPGNSALLAGFYDGTGTSFTISTCNTFGGAQSEKMRIQSGGGISFNGDTTAANALDDYEEGNLSWHLAKTSAPGQGSNNGSLVKYVKVGRLVHISGRIRTDSVDGSGSHSFIFQSGSTLPFTPETSGTSVIGHIRSQDQSDGSLTASIAWASGSTTLYIYTIDAGSDYSADSNNVGAKTQTNLVMTFSLTYRANS